ncbi:IS110 family transposase [Flexistipes sinusarabici]|nr:IS110 family transposase [Flexistipes sinusarabici]
MRSFTMKSYEKVVGIDVSKETLSISLYDGKSHISYETRNTVKSFFNDFVKKEKGIDFSKVLFMLENTGVYHLRLATHLSKECGYIVSVANPLVIKRYSQMNLKRVKTDKADARLIAEYGYINGDDWLFSPRDIDYYKIDMKLKAVEDFHKQINMLSNQIEAIEYLPFKDNSTLNAYKKLIENFKKEIKKIEKELDILLREKYVEEYKLLSSIPGVGLKLTGVILGKLNGFANFDRGKDVTSFVGICPSIYQSGTSVNGRGKISKKGNGYMRTILYLCSLSACKYNKSCAELYERLVAKGKPKKVALIAVANKLIRQAFGVLKSGKPYDPDHANNLTLVAKNA